MTTVYEAAPDHVAQVHLVSGMCWVYIRRVTYKQVRYVPLRWHATTKKMSMNEWDECVLDSSIHPASADEIERFQRLTSAWRND